GIRGTHGGGDPLRPSVEKAVNDGDDELQDPEGGYIFEAFKRAGAQPPSDNPTGLTMGIYGERTARESGDMNAYKAPGWKDGDIHYAVGRIVEALSKSPFWGSTVVMQTEDDTQAAGDHVNSLRDYLEVSGPWAQAGPNTQWGSMPALLRTIEQLFNVQPVSIYDKLAIPMHNAFKAELSDGPSMAPYTAEKPLIPFAINQPGAPEQQLSMAQNW